jgi:hypothetical protein
MSKTQTYPQYYVSQNNLLLLFGLTTLLCQCTQKYVSPYTSPPTGYLVVEGYISGNSLTQYTLSRTIPLPGDSAIPLVTGATVQVEGNDNSVYPLVEQGSGVYADSFTLNPISQYRLRIKAPNGESYLSDFVPYKPTPAIDSVTWIPDTSGANFYVYTHDPANATKYYQWTYAQTWEYISAEPSLFVYLPASNTVVPRTPAQQVYRCWQNKVAPNVLIASTAALAQDVVYQFPLLQVPENSQQFAILYSLLVNQYALTDSGYQFYSILQKNTESLGSIFDAQPSQLIGNIHCMNNPGETVIGYISAGTVSRQRLFIRRDQLPHWDYFYTCPQTDTFVANDPASFIFWFARFNYMPIINSGSGNYLSGYYSNSKYCIDCTQQGGTNLIPTFWPN